MPDLSIKRRNLLAGLSAAAALPLLYTLDGRARAATAGKFEVTKTDAQWHAQLSPAAFYVLREAGTERAGTSPLNDEHRAGTFACAGCALPLFSSKAKFDSGTGWPSFWQPLPNAVERSSGGSAMFGIEVHCRRCGGHLGHVFSDGPQPTGLRYCINGVALGFTPARV